MRLRLVNLTRIDSMVIFNPNRDIVEDRKVKIGLSFKEISTIMTRIKLIIFLIEYLKNIDRPVFYFNYPRFSVFVYFVRIKVKFVVASRPNDTVQSQLHSHLSSFFRVLLGDFLFKVLGGTHHTSFLLDVLQR